MLTFLVIKAVNLFLNGGRGIALAASLGPEKYGVFGTVILLQQYLSYLALGVREGVAIKLARSSGAIEERKSIHASALAWGCLSGVFSALLVFALHFFWRPIAHVYMWVCLISALSILNEILININRYENKLKKVALAEFAYCSIALLPVVALYPRMSVDLALASVFAGALVSVALYLVSITDVTINAWSWPMSKELVKVGVLPAIFSAVIVLSNTFYVVSANWLDLGRTVGLVVFGNNMSVMILFGLNTVSWALTSRSMSRLYMRTGSKEIVDVADFSEIFLRFGVIAAAASAISTQVLFQWVMTSYHASTVYILLFCLFQSYGLLLFSEFNFLSVNSRLKLVIYAYLGMTLALAVLTLVAREIFPTLLELGIVAHFLLALLVTLYCRRIGFVRGQFSHRIAALFFPVGCAVLYLSTGFAGAVAVCVIFFSLACCAYGKRLGALLRY